MAIDDFIPELWHAEILSALRKQLVYGQLGVINMDYQGQIENEGDTVHITSIGDVSVAAYTEHSTTLTYSALTDTDTPLVIDQAQSWTFKAGDIEEKQAAGDFVTEASSRAAYSVSDVIDQYVAALLYAGVNDTANDLGAKTADISDNSGYGNVLVALRTKLNRANVPSQGRWAVVPAEFYGALLQDNRFVDASASADGGAAIRNGYIGRAVGFDLYESNNTPDPTSGTYAVIAGHPWACTFATQIMKAESLRLEGAFATGYRGLAVYGGKVVRPTCLAMASVTVQA